MEENSRIMPIFIHSLIAFILYPSILKEGEREKEYKRPPRSLRPGFEEKKKRANKSAQVTIDQASEEKTIELLTQS